MKKLAIMLIALATTIACKNESTDGYTVTGNIKGIEDGSQVLLKVEGENDLIVKDSAKIENGKFVFKGGIENPEMAYIVSDQIKGIPFIIEKGNIEITFDKDSLQNTKIGGTKENNILQEYSSRNKAIYEKIDAFQKDNNQKYMEAQQANDTVTMNALQAEITAMQEDLKVIPKEIIEKNQDSYISLLLIERALMQQILTLDEAKAYFTKYGDKFANTKTYKALDKMITAAGSVEVGKKAPEFSAPSPDGTTISLKESLGKVTIIDFWASWCGPCRMENPNVVALYNEFHDKGLNILGVSLDKDAEKWKDAIEKDGLTWNHISNLKYWQEPIAEMYNVKSIPATFILDKDGVIVARDLRGNELKAKVEELLKQ